MRHFGLVIATILLAGCAGSPGSSPEASPLGVSDVTGALANAGIAVVDVADNLNARDSAWKCLPGAFRLARVSQQAAGLVARVGD
jgi:hypothetical protein